MVRNTAPYQCADETDCGAAQYGIADVLGCPYVRHQVACQFGNFGERDDLVRTALANGRVDLQNRHAKRALPFIIIAFQPEAGDNITGKCAIALRRRWEPFVDKFATVAKNDAVRDPDSEGDNWLANGSW
jgi:hypothetical protein